MPTPRSWSSRFRRGRGESAEEARSPALGGFKVAHPLVSVDGRHLGFHGVTLGRGHVYGRVADAVCTQNVRHRSPSSRCDCGFYCFGSRDAAVAMSGDPEHAGCVLLEILASGHYLRYELGLRYERQTIQAVVVGVCGCGQAAVALADGGPGAPGWRRLTAVCRACAGTRPVLTLQRYGELAGGMRVDTAPGIDAPESTFAPLPATTVDDTDLDEAALVPLLSAEVALLQARLDQLQGRLEQLTRRAD